MCGRFAVLTYEEVAVVAEAVEKRLGLATLSGCDAPRPHAFPGSTVSLLAPDDAGSIGIAQATWGFETAWSKRLVFNTRVESALDGTALWRDAIQTGRCIIPVASFFEPHASETVPSPRTGRAMKRPYEFTDPTGAPLLLAGLVADDRCSIVTCEPNKWVAPVHNRMPLVMRFQEVATWFSPDWPLLADRSDFDLRVQPEQLHAPEPDSQLSLF